MTQRYLDWQVAQFTSYSSCELLIGGFFFALCYEPKFHLQQICYCLCEVKNGAMKLLKKGGCSIIASAGDQWRSSLINPWSFSYRPFSKDFARVFTFNMSLALAMESIIKQNWEAFQISSPRDGERTVNSPRISWMSYRDQVLKLHITFGCVSLHVL